jgi:hypothetical protein
LGGALLREQQKGEIMQIMGMPDPVVVKIVFTVNIRLLSADI